MTVDELAPRLWLVGAEVMEDLGHHQVLNGRIVPKVNLGHFQQLDKMFRILWVQVAYEALEILGSGKVDNGPVDGDPVQLERSGPGVDRPAGTNPN